jgi:Glycosyl transferases group 1
MLRDKLRVLVVGARYPYRSSYYDDWAEAFEAADCFGTTQADIIDIKPTALARQLEEQELVVLLHSCTADTLHWARRIAPVLADRKRPRLITFVGNEYNSLHAPMADKLDLLRACHPDIIATQLLEEAGRYLYADTSAAVLSVPHALNPDMYRPGPAHAGRPIDIGVRNFRYSPLVGDNVRNSIIDYFAQHGGEYGLITDIKTHHRFGRQDWAVFLGACRGTVSSEAGSWYLDRTDALVMRIGDELKANRKRLVIGEDGPLRQLTRRLPLPVKDVLAWLLRHGPVKYSAFEEHNADFDDLYARYFHSEPRCPAYSKAISSRHLEAAGTQTCQILVRGRYNDIFVPDEHYLPVAPDLSDVDEAVARFKDETECMRIAANAYEHVLSKHTYAHRIAQLYTAVHAL